MRTRRGQLHATMARCQKKPGTMASRKWGGGGGNTTQANQGQERFSLGEEKTGGKMKAQACTSYGFRARTYSPLEVQKTLQ